MKTYSAKPQDIQKEWLIFDAKDVVLGRMAAEIAKILRGKHKPSFTPNMDCGDNVIVINADKIHLTGNKLDQDIFYWHTGYPGGIKQRSKGQILNGAYPERVVQKAVERMLPKTKLGRKQLKNLRVYAGEEHNHEAQNPRKIDFANANVKNTKRI